MEFLSGCFAGRDAPPPGVVEAAEHEGSTTLPEALPRASPDPLPPTTGTHDWHLDNGAPIG
jgi:hypothetical protein